MVKLETIFECRWILSAPFIFFVLMILSLIRISWFGFRICDRP
jgi:hypothetical protein